MTRRPQALIVQRAVRNHRFRKHVLEKRGKIFRPPSLAEALDHRDYQLPTAVGGDAASAGGTTSRLLPLCSSLRTIEERASPDVALQLLLQRSLMALFLALTLLTSGQLGRTAWHKPSSPCKRAFRNSEAWSPAAPGGSQASYMWRVGPAGSLGAG